MLGSLRRQALKGQDSERVAEQCRQLPIGDLERPLGAEREGELRATRVGGHALPAPAGFRGLGRDGAAESARQGLESGDVGGLRLRELRQGRPEGLEPGAICKGRIERGQVARDPERLPDELRNRNPSRPREIIEREGRLDHERSVHLPILTVSGPQSLHESLTFTRWRLHLPSLSSSQAVKEVAAEQAAQAVTRWFLHPALYPPSWG